MSDDRDTASGSDSGETAQRAAPATELAKGLSLGRYIVLAKLGAGGMGVVYAAYDPELDRKVAIKLLRRNAEPKSHGDRGTKLLQEAKDMARLNHPNVVTVHDVGTFLGQVFIAMEFIGGGTLGEWIKKRPGWQQVLACFLRAGEGLAAAHEQGLVHRDFKPENVLLDSNREPRVTDFGLARRGEVAAREGHLGPVAGTIGYLAPEQARNQVVDARSDQFSFCVSLYLGLYGEPPFHRDSDLVKPLLPVRPAPSGSTVPGWLRRVVIKGLAEDPATRYPSMRELLNALTADPAKARREWAVRGSGALLLLSVIGLGAFFAQRETPEEKAQRECGAEVERQVGQIWGPVRRQEIETAFSGNPSDWEKVSERLSPEVDAWSAISKRACRMRTEARVLTAACLEERRKTLQSMSNLFASADPQGLENALTTIILEVSPASSCVASQTTPAPIHGPAAVEQAGGESLALARVMQAAGKYDNAITEALKVADGAQKKGNRLLEAEAMLLAGQTSQELNAREGHVAEEELHKAIALADSVGDDEIRAQGWISLITLYAERVRFNVPGAMTNAMHADGQARAVIERLGTPPLLEADHQMALGILATAPDADEEPRVYFRSALELRKAHLRPDHPFIAVAQTNLALSLDRDQGLPLLLEMLAQQEKFYGPNHPKTAVAHFNVGARYLGPTCDKDDNTQKALTHFNLALEILSKNGSSDLQRLGRFHYRTGLTLECLGQLPEAESQLREGAQMLHDAGSSNEEQYEAADALLRVMIALKRSAAQRMPYEELLKGLKPELKP